MPSTQLGLPHLLTLSKPWLVKTTPGLGLNLLSQLTHWVTYALQGKLRTYPMLATLQLAILCDLSIDREARRLAILMGDTVRQYHTPGCAAPAVWLSGCLAV